MDAGGSLLLKPTREGAVRRWRQGRSGLGCCVGEGAASAAAAMDAGVVSFLNPPGRELFGGGGEAVQDLAAVQEKERPPLRLRWMRGVVSF
ncbi:hypothetical protein NDU88_008165 [Pleurodeles waltl]|uniref:Uncharacterized protein n=1 Tax=Pleurodeles waltl TaxID=8319 RepID=A0AAV7U395_PLEWA|nr:hypothetical protein NDU88_008165 [Pleurodeles waltl]